MARSERIEKMEDHESFLICSNPKCRYLVDLREGTQVLDRASLIIEECPECGYPWSNSCPFCGRRLKATRRGNISHCAHCKEKLLPLKNKRSAGKEGTPELE
jgi:predicted amidophosphoribosyltransferase